jgi:hypothetical protein
VPWGRAPHSHDPALVLRECFYLVDACISINMVNKLNLCFFVPFQAHKKGLDGGDIGFVFGVFELVKLIMAPIFGNYVSFLFDSRSKN